MKTERYAAVDYLKALAIVAVVVTHAGFWDRDPRFTWADRMLRGSWVPFQVPAFYVVSGFLYYRATAIGWRTVAQRLHRILLPYGIASLAVFALGISDSGVSIVRALVTGSALQIYYFIFALACCVAFLPLLSRLPRAGLVAVLAALVVYEIAVLCDPGLRLAGPLHLFWYSRDPFSSFALGLFVSGFLGAAALPEIRAWHERRPWILPTFASLAIAVWLARFFDLLDLGHSVFPVRVLYTYGVIAAVVTLAAGRSVSAPVAFLTRATLAIYLYHRFAQIPLIGVTLEWPAPLRILALTIAGVAGPCAALALARRASPQWSRRLLGG